MLDSRSLPLVPFQAIQKLQRLRQNTRLRMEDHRTRITNGRDASGEGPGSSGLKRDNWDLIMDNSNRGHHIQSKCFVRTGTNHREGAWPDATKDQFFGLSMGDINFHRKSTPFM